MTRGPLRDLGRLNPTCPATFHGTYSAYRYGCRCPHAREDNRIYQKRQREGRGRVRYVDSTGTRRRLQALAVLGWRWRDIGDRLGVSWQGAQRLALLDRDVHVTTRNRVAAVYRELCDRPGPSAVTARRAAGKGWHGPLAWADIDDPACRPDTGHPDGPVVDEWAVAECVAGQLPASRLSEVDLAEAVRRMLAGGLRPGQVRHRLGLSQSQLNRAVRSLEVAA